MKFNESLRKSFFKFFESFVQWVRLYLLNQPRQRTGNAIVNKKTFQHILIYIKFQEQVRYELCVQFSFFWESMYLILKLLSKIAIRSELIYGIQGKGSKLLTINHINKEVENHCFFYLNIQQCSLIATTRVYHNWRYF